MAKHLFTGFSTQKVAPGSSKTTVYDIELIKIDLLNQFMTKKGERLMLPNYGTIIWDQLFEPFTETVQSLILEDVLHIVNSEPRVTVNTVTSTQTDYGISVAVSLYYIPFNAVDSLALTFDRENQDFS
jgi:phage baseplate assembly protein W